MERQYGKINNMIVDSKNNIVYMNEDEAETYETLPTGDTYPDPVALDPDLGLELVEEKPSIFAKYGVHCDPKKNSFHESLYNQYEKRGSLSAKQINALRNSY